MSHKIAWAFFAALLLPACGHADTVELVAGGARDSVDIPATQALLREPFGTAFDATGTAWIVEMSSGNRLLNIEENGVLRQVVRRDAGFNGPHNLAILPGGDVLIGDTWNGKVRRVDPRTGQITDLEGWSVPKEKAQSQGPYCIALSPDGVRLYIANLQQIHELNLATKTSRVVAGNGKKGVPTDGAVAVDAPLSDPRAVAADGDGNIYILERGGNALRVIEKTGHIRTVVNISGAKGATGDGGSALQATMNGPKHICLDRDGSVLIADAENHLIRRYVPATGRIERVAGTGVRGSAGLGSDPLQCQLNRPHGVTVHPQSGEIYITDSYNNRVLKITRQAARND